MEVGVGCLGKTKGFGVCVGVGCQWKGIWWVNEWVEGDLIFVFKTNFCFYCSLTRFDSWVMLKPAGEGEGDCGGEWLSRLTKLALIWLLQNADSSASSSRLGSLRPFSSRWAASSSSCPASSPSSAVAVASCAARDPTAPPPASPQQLPPWCQTAPRRQPSMVRGMVSSHCSVSLLAFYTS